MAISQGPTLNLGTSLNEGFSLNYGVGLSGDPSGVVPSDFVLKLETGFNFLLETGSFILLED